MIFKTVYLLMHHGASQVGLVIKNPPSDAGDVRGMGLIPGSGRSPGGGHGNPPQYAHMENPMDRGGWRATVHLVAKSWIRLKRLRHLLMHRGIMHLDKPEGVGLLQGGKGAVG